MKKLLRKLFNLDSVDELKNIRDAFDISHDASIIDYIQKLKNEEPFIPASAQVDWKEMNAFSIERIPRTAAFNNKNSKTNIGYFKTIDGKLQQSEWVLYTSVEEHERLVKEFKEYVNQKYK